MKIFIPSYGRAGIITTHQLLKGQDYRILVHDSSEYSSYAQNPTIDRNRLVTTGQPLGIARQRNWVLDHLVEAGEWFCFMDDNIRGFEKLRGGLYDLLAQPVESFGSTFWGPRYKNPVEAKELMKALSETAEHASDIGTHFAGCATTDNFFFRGKKWRETGFVCTKLAIVRAGTLRFDPRFTAKDDVDFSAANLQKYGKVLVNNYLFPRGAHFSPGGIGKKDIRRFYSQQDAALLVKKWPTLCAYSRRQDGDLPTEVSFKK